MKILCSAKQECFDAQVAAEQQVSVYQRAKPYTMLGRWVCCPPCFEGVMQELKRRNDLIAVIWRINRKVKVEGHPVTSPVM